MSQKDPNIHTLLRVKDCDLKEEVTKIINTTIKKAMFHLYRAILEFILSDIVHIICEEAKQTQTKISLCKFLPDDMINEEL